MRIEDVEKEGIVLVGILNRTGRLLRVWCPSCKKYHQHEWDPENEEGVVECRMAHCPPKRPRKIGDEANLYYMYVANLYYYIMPAPVIDFDEVITTEETTNSVALTQKDWIRERSRLIAALKDENGAKNAQNARELVPIESFCRLYYCAIALVARRLSPISCQGLFEDARQFLVETANQAGEAFGTRSCNLSGIEAIIVTLEERMPPPPPPEENAQTDKRFIAAGHKPGDKMCNHSAWSALSPPRPRHCPDCNTAMWDAGD